jgi:hypothetical protein
MPINAFADSPGPWTLALGAGDKSRAVKDYLVKSEALARVRMNGQRL